VWCGPSCVASRDAARSSARGTRRGARVSLGSCALAARAAAGRQQRTAAVSLSHRRAVWGRGWRGKRGGDRRNEPCEAPRQASAAPRRAGRPVWLLLLLVVVLALFLVRRWGGCVAGARGKRRSPETRRLLEPRDPRVAATARSARLERSSLPPPSPSSCHHCRHHHHRCQSLSRQSSSSSS
jgi:hypothetical protein